MKKLTVYLLLSRIAAFALVGCGVLQEPEAASGPIELRLAGRTAPQLTTSAAFLMPDGRRLELAPQSWEIAP